MNRRLFAALSTAIPLAITGCMTARPIIGPDGTKNHLISCYSIEGCYSEAREVCGGNYKIVNTNAETSGNKDGVSTLTRLLVKCDRGN